jgi:hypothetical protein
MKYAVEMGSGAVICVPSLMKIGSGIHREGYIYIQRTRCCNKPTFSKEGK